MDGVRLGEREAWWRRPRKHEREACSRRRSLRRGSRFPSRIFFGCPYRGQKNVAFTANVEDRRLLFRDAAVVAAMLPVLAEQTARFDCLVGIYCFMPDHLHLIVCSQSDKADAKAAMDAFKTKTGLWLGERRPGWFWQDGYHDHIVRKGDDWRRQVHCTYMNPVRKGLVEDPADWPHTGAIGFDLIELMIDANY